MFTFFCIGAIIMHLLWEVKCLCSVDWTNLHSSMVSSAEAEWLRKRQATWRKNHPAKDGNPVTVPGVLGLPVMSSLWYYLLCKLPFALRFAGHTTRIAAHNKWYHQNKRTQLYQIHKIRKQALIVNFQACQVAPIFRDTNWTQHRVHPTLKVILISFRTNLDDQQ